MTRRFSDAWMNALRSIRTKDWPDEAVRHVPMLPWITPPVPKNIRSLFEIHGRPLCVPAGESLFGTSFVTDFILITSGLSGRYLTPDRVLDGDAILALSPTGRFACGNLNFITRRPTIGRYGTVSDLEALALSHGALEELILPNTQLFRELAFHLETTNLSDRMAFCMMVMLPAATRVKALLLAWAAYFGTLDGGWVTLPSPGRNAHIERVVGVSSVTMDKVRTELQTTGGFERDGDFLRIRAEALQDVHDWMRRTDDDSPLYRRPARVEDFLEEMLGDGTHTYLS